jgi:DNA-binding PucR family transcriptional regulator
VIVNLEEQYNLLLQVESKRKTGIIIKDAYISSLKKQLKEKDLDKKEYEELSELLQDKLRAEEMYTDDLKKQIKEKDEMIETLKHTISVYQDRNNNGAF